MNDSAEAVYPVALCVTFSASIIDRRCIGSEAVLTNKVFSRGCPRVESCRRQPVRIVAVVEKFDRPFWVLLVSILRQNQIHIGSHSHRRDINRLVSSSQ